MKPKSGPIVRPKTLMAPEVAELTKKKLVPARQGRQALGQSFCTKWGENISMGSWTTIEGAL